MTDITAHREMESELKIKDYAIESSVAGFAFIDMEGKLTYVNPALQRMGGYPVSEVVGKPASLFFADEAVWDEALPIVCQAGSWQGELAIKNKSGSIVATQVAASLVKDAEGKPVCIMASLIDITQRKQAEQVKDEFIGLVSHELRTPLTVFMSAVKVALNDGLSVDEVRELLDEAVLSADSLSHILDNLIELSRYQSQRLKLSVTRTDIRALVSDILETEVYAKGHALVLDDEGEFPEMDVDRLRVRQIMRNLISNASKYSPAGTEIRVSLKLKEGFIVIGVTDQGKGISREQQEKLFQPYQRLGETRAEGLGLGLLVCRRLVEAHGGRIWVESEPGQGATFRFSLPLPAE